jgi:hypothetical protein
MLAGHGLPPVALGVSHLPPPAHPSGAPCLRPIGVRRLSRTYVSSVGQQANQLHQPKR